MTAICAANPPRTDREVETSLPYPAAVDVRLTPLYCGPGMPKMKSHSGAKKRFKVTGSGKVQGRHAYSSHMLEHKSPKRKRRMGRPTEIAKPDQKRVKTLLNKRGGK